MMRLPELWKELHGALTAASQRVRSRRRAARARVRGNFEERTPGPTTLRGQHHNAELRQVLPSANVCPPRSRAHPLTGGRRRTGRHTHRVLAGPDRGGALPIPGSYWRSFAFAFFSCAALVTSTRRECPSLCSLISHNISTSPQSCYPVSTCVSPLAVQNAQRLESTPASLVARCLLDRLCRASFATTLRRRSLAAGAL